MSSFQSAHKVANDLAEVLITSPVIDLSAGASVAAFPVQPALAGKSYRIIEVGFTVTETLATAASGAIDVGTSVAAAPASITGDRIIDGATVPNEAAGPSGVNNYMSSTGAVYSTSVGGSDAWAFNTATGSALDSGGVPRLISGEVITYTVASKVGAGEGIIFVRLAPEINRDIDL